MTVFEVETEKRSIGNTPLVELDGIYVKLECVNVCGSIKDRIAKYIIDKSERMGLLHAGMTIVEATSGNTGIALSYYARKKGYEITIIMPENMSAERKEMITGFGADLILCSEEGSFAEAADIRDNMAEDNRYFNPDQFSNPLNVECHFRNTGQEIIDQMNANSGEISAFVAGVGTGGTLIGVGKALREKFPDVVITAVEPAESAVMSGGEPGSHGIPGIGDGFIPAIASDGKGGLHSLIDEVICISSEDAIEATQEINERFGLCVGISSGANYLAATELSRRFSSVTTVFPDGYTKYQTMGLKYCGKDKCPHDEECG